MTAQCTQNPGIAILRKVGFNGLEGAKWNISSTNGAGAPPLSTQDQMQYLGLHMSTERNARPAVPSRDISRYTGDDGATRNTRGILFVRDLLHEGGRSGGPFDMSASLNVGEFDQGLGDWRLSPGGRGPDAQNAPIPPSEGNFVIDAGFTWVHGGSQGNLTPITMANGLSVAPDVFSLDADEESFPHDCNDWDGEGYGNPRVYDHPVYTTIATAVPTGIVITTDLGADEHDHLLIVGYREKTTFFMDQDLGTVVAENDFAFFLCLSENLPDGNVATNMAPPTEVPLFPFQSGAYIADPAWLLLPTATYYTPEYVDITPHLIPDIHPWWAPIIGSASNINWLPCGPNASLRNVALYMSPSIGLINPPGSYIVTSSPSGFNWLEVDIWTLFSSTMPLAQFQTAAVPSTSMDNSPTSGPFCLLEPLSGPVVIRPSGALLWGTTTSGGLRVTCEWLRTGQPWWDVPLDLNRGANLQSFLSTR